MMPRKKATNGMHAATSYPALCLIFQLGDSKAPAIFLYLDDNAALDEVGECFLNRGRTSLSPALLSRERMIRLG
jgi:hypothetical protein